ncbi:MAG TPA: hypothetical protein VKP30_00540 [Polyangiaceae bacterium]|nr:hypothetical protein [Polyangiaceae bacterium]
MDYDILAVTLDDFKITTSLTRQDLVVRMSGMGDIVAVKPLERCLNGVLEGIFSEEIGSVEFDIRRLELLNSSCLKSFASFILQLVSKKSSCPIRFIVDARLPWQARCLFALERLAHSRVTIVPR